MSEFLQATNTVYGTAYENSGDIADEIAALETLLDTDVTNAADNITGFFDDYNGVIHRTINDLADLDVQINDSIITRDFGMVDATPRMVRLSPEEVDFLGEGQVVIKASQTDAAGNEHDDGSVASDNFVIDTIDPSVAAGADQVDATGSMSSDTGAEVVVDADDAGTVTITATFNEPMDQGVLPTFNLQPDVAQTLTAQDTGSWSDATTFSITYDVADANFDTDTVSVDVEGAFDVAGNPMTDYTADVEFGIDTRNPEVTGIVSNFADIEGNNVVSDSDPVVSYTVSFSEPIVDVVDVDIAVSGGTLDAGSVVVAEGGMSATFSVTATQESVADLTVTINNTVVDVHGNTLVEASASETVDTLNPKLPAFQQVSTRMLMMMLYQTVTLL